VHSWQMIVHVSFALWKYDFPLNLWTRCSLG
jgi:hypothetical protein